jgi:hypothetical protein
MKDIIAQTGMQEKNNKTLKKCLDERTARRGTNRTPVACRREAQKVQNSSLEATEAVVDRPSVLVVQFQEFLTFG